MNTVGYYTSRNSQRHKYASRRRSLPRDVSPFKKWPRFKGRTSRDLYQYLEQIHNSFFSKNIDPQDLIGFLTSHHPNSFFRKCLEPFISCYSYQGKLKWDLWYEIVGRFPLVFPDIIDKLRMQDGGRSLQKAISVVNEFVREHPNLVMYAPTWVSIYHYFDEYHNVAHNEACKKCPALQYAIVNNSPELWSSYRSALIVYDNLEFLDSIVQPLLATTQPLPETSSNNNKVTPTPLYSPYSDTGDYKQILALMDEEGPISYQPLNATCHFCGSSTHNHFHCAFLEPLIELNILHFNDKRLFDIYGNYISFDCTPWYTSKTFEAVVKVALAKWARDEIPDGKDTAELVDRNVLMLVYTLEEEVNQHPTHIRMILTDKKTIQMGEDAKVNRNFSVSQLIDRAYLGLASLKPQTSSCSDPKIFTWEVILNAVLELPIQDSCFSKLAKSHDMFLTTFVKRFQAPGK